MRRSRNIGLAPDQFLHRQIRSDPGPSAAGPAGSVIHAEYESKPSRLGGGVAEHLMPLRGAETDWPGRNILGDIHEQSSAQPDALHGFEIRGDAFAGDVSIEPKPIYPRPSIGRWLGKTVREVFGGFSRNGNRSCCGEQAEGDSNQQAAAGCSAAQLGEVVMQMPFYCRSYSPFWTRLRTLNPAFLASEIERALGELKVENTFRTGFLQAGHFVNGAAESGRLRVNLPPHTLQPPSHSSYSYSGIRIHHFLSANALMNGLNRSIGTGKKVVVLCSLEISRMVWRKRNWRAMGSLLIIAAACTIFSAAWNSPSALTILARRSRSASACLAIARFMLSGSATSLTSTAVTFTPQGSVCRSMISCNLKLMLSRCESKSSSEAWPSTLRRVV